jgi:hypothetical protein
MARINGTDLESLQTLAIAFMSDGDNWQDGKPKDCSMVDSGSLAWSIASKCGITAYCYGDTSRDLPGLPGICDAHIKTALQHIFPNAIFRDKYAY